MDDRRLLSQIADAFGLGDPVAAEARHGGVNRVWQLTTVTGTFAVHELLGIPDEVDATARCQRINELEIAAAAAGVALARPIADQDGRAAVTLDERTGVFTVHEWVDALPLTDRQGTPELYRRLGSSVGLLHSLHLDASGLPGDAIGSHLGVSDWEDIADAGKAGGWKWADVLRDAAAEFVEAVEAVDRWDAAADDPSCVFSHRDLTSGNVLALGDVPIIVDWESAGPVPRGVELGRTALDQLTPNGQLDQTGLASLLRGYAEVRPLPAVGRDWCSLWVRGLVVFAEHCARSCIASIGPPSLLERQARIVETSPAELRRRLTIVDDLVDSFSASITPAS